MVKRNYTRLVERRTSKLLDKLKVYDSSRKQYEITIKNRFMTKGGDFTKKGLEKIDLLVKKTKTKKFAGQSNIQKLRTVVGNKAYKEFKDRFELNGNEWKKKLKEINEMSWYDITDKYLNDMSEWYFEERNNLNLYWDKEKGRTGKDRKGDYSDVKKLTKKTEKKMFKKYDDKRTELINSKEESAAADLMKNRFLRK